MQYSFPFNIKMIVTNVTKVDVRVFLILFVLVQLYILRSFRAVIDQQTWTDLGSVSERRLRSEILSLACHLNDPGCVQRARQSFNDWLLSNYTLKYVWMSTHYQSPSDVHLHLGISQLRSAFWCVFTSACPPTLQRRCIQLELKMIMAGRHSYMYTISLSLKLRRIRSCLRWPAAESQIN